MRCFNEQAPEYQRLEQASGISKFKLRAFVSSYYDKYGKFPQLDQIPGSNSQPFLQKELDIHGNEDFPITTIENISKLLSNDSERLSILEMQHRLNNQFRDQEITLLETGVDDQVVIKMKPRPTLYSNLAERQLDLESLTSDIEIEDSTGILINIVKQEFPNCNLGMLTNGLLLRNMNESFWNSCIKNNVKLKITCFPIFSEDDIEQIEHILNQWGIEYQLTRKIKFNKILIENNKSSMEEIIKACGCNNAYNLYDGYVSRCTVPMITELFNRKFGTNLNTDGRLNIYESTAEDIISFLSTPNKSCTNCSAFPQKVLWEKASKYPAKEDWIIEE